MTKIIKAGIIGAAGYTGGEAIRLLLRHPFVQLFFVQSRSQAGNRVDSIHRDLTGDTDLSFVEKPQEQVDVLFFCLGHGESSKFLFENYFPAQTRVIDLGNDFRLGDDSGSRKFVYGLPEFQRDNIRKAENIANPGCFATAIQLGVLPLAVAQVLPEFYTTGITGSTGAGQKPQVTTHFTWRDNNISAYKTLTHQHVGEILRTLKSLQTGFDKGINFVPWRGDFTRGIFTTTVLSIDWSLEALISLYREYYESHPFTIVADSMIDLKQVVNTNKCLIHLEKVGDKFAVHTVLDNLIKGASGQAIQNMNLMFGLEETEGLKLKGSVF
jgi:N-acetyl-gamma-glutamyl-phosphate reductase